MLVLKINREVVQGVQTNGHPTCDKSATSRSYHIYILSLNLKSEKSNLTTVIKHYSVSWLA